MRIPLHQRRRSDLNGLTAVLNTFLKRSQESYMDCRTGPVASGTAGLVLLSLLAVNSLPEGPNAYLRVLRKQQGFSDDFERLH